MSTRSTYASGETGCANPALFGSFQISQSRTHGKRFCAAAAKFPKSAPFTGKELNFLPPFAHSGA